MNLCLIEIYKHQATGYVSLHYLTSSIKKRHINIITVTWCIGRQELHKKCNLIIIIIVIITDSDYALKSKGANRN